MPTRRAALPGSLLSHLRSVQYLESQPTRLLIRHEARRIAANIAKLPERPERATSTTHRSHPYNREFRHDLCYCNDLLTRRLADEDLNVSTAWHRALALCCALTTPSRAEVKTLICAFSMATFFTFIFDIDFTKQTVAMFPFRRGRRGAHIQSLGPQRSPIVRYNGGLTIATCFRSTALPA